MLPSFPYLIGVAILWKTTLPGLSSHVTHVIKIIINEPKMFPLKGEWDKHLQWEPRAGANYFKLIFHLWNTLWAVVLIFLILLPLLDPVLQPHFLPGGREDQGRRRRDPNPGGGPRVLWLASGAQPDHLLLSYLCAPPLLWHPVQKMTK